MGGVIWNNPHFVGGRGDTNNLLQSTRFEPLLKLSLVQILVVVATIQRNYVKVCMGATLCRDFERYALKTEVAKVFLTTVIDQELVDPKPKDYEK